jgi:hypothetical protein
MESNNKTNPEIQGKDLNKLMENNYLFDNNFKKQMKTTPDYNNFLKPFSMAPRQVTYPVPPNSVDDNIPEILKEGNNENNDDDANPIFSQNQGWGQGFPQMQGMPQAFSQMPQAFDGFPHLQGMPQMQGLPQAFQGMMPSPGLGFNGYPGQMNSIGVNPYLNNPTTQQGMMPPAFQSQMGFGQNPFNNGMKREDLPEFLQNIIDETPEYLRL